MRADNWTDPLTLGLKLAWIAAVVALIGWQVLQRGLDVPRLGQTLVWFAGLIVVVTLAGIVLIEALGIDAETA